MCRGTLGGCAFRSQSPAASNYCRAGRSTRPLREDETRNSLVDSSAVTLTGSGMCSHHVRGEEAIILLQ